MSVGRKLRHGAKGVSHGLLVVLLYVLDYVGLQEVFATAGFVMIMVGVWMVSPAASLVLCGTILLWYALPSRPPFVARPETLRKER